MKRRQALDLGPPAFAAGGCLTALVAVANGELIAAVPTVAGSAIVAAISVFNSQTLLQKYEKEDSENA